MHCLNCGNIGKQPERPCSTCGFCGVVDGFVTFLPVPALPMAADARTYATQIAENLIVSQTTGRITIN